MLAFPSDHDLFLSIPCGIEGSRHDLEYIVNDEAQEDSLQNNPEILSQFITEIIPCKNTRLCLLRVIDGQMTYTQLADVLGIHRGNAVRLVGKMMTQLRLEFECKAASLKKLRNNPQ